MLRPVFLLPLVIGLPATVLSAGGVHWKSGASELRDMGVSEKERTLADLSTQARSVGAGRTGRHAVVRLTSQITSAQREDLRAKGLTVLRPLGHGTFFAVVDPGKADAVGLAQIDMLGNVTPVDRNWKLHPSLGTGSPPPWAVTARDGETRQPHAIAACVLLHPDVELGFGVNVLTAHGAVVRSRLSTINAVVIELPVSSIDAVADEDVVQWIEPPLPALSPVNDSNRLITQVEDVQGQPYGLDGAGVNVLVYDGGTALSTHVDFGGRLTVHDSAPAMAHATHVAGTIGGDGTASGGLYRGMAPAVTIRSYAMGWDGTETFLYDNLCDLQDDYLDAVLVQGAHVANNSLGTNLGRNVLYDPEDFACQFTGDYGATDVLIDNIVRGALGAPFRIIWSNGNERNPDFPSCRGVPGGYTGPNCVSSGECYHSTVPPACAKNHITVGAVNSNDDSMTVFSSWGPTDDGRLKPDVCAPGSQSNGDLGVTSTICHYNPVLGTCEGYEPNNLYESSSGTSMAAPTVTGIAALMLQDFRAHFPNQPDFRNSTLKILLAHNAFERGNIGPDYQFGYGSVRAEDTIKFMRTGNFREMTIDQGESFCALVEVTQSDIESGKPLKVTLAWDDYPGTPNVSPALVNDLDLRVYDPSGTVQYYPWTLDPENPSDAADRDKADHLNNIEQVQVDTGSLSVGMWRVEVHGYDVPAGPQPFSICESPVLIVDCNCNQIRDSQETDCNANGMLDHCDVQSGFSPDCDEDWTPDECEADTDDDEHVDDCDNCPLIANADQADCDTDGVGDVCDTGDSEEDGVPDNEDNCPCDANADQTDCDGDNVGNVCDPVPEAMFDGNCDNDTDQDGFSHVQECQGSMCLCGPAPEGDPWGCCASEWPCYDAWITRTKVPEGSWPYYLRPAVVNEDLVLFERCASGPGIAAPRNCGDCNGDGIHDAGQDFVPNYQGVRFSRFTLRRRA